MDASRIAFDAQQGVVVSSRAYDTIDSLIAGLSVSIGHSKLKQVHRPEVNVFRNTPVFYKSTNILKLIIYMNHVQTHGIIIKKNE